ncbi:HNH endonuclease [bacterium M00.F.Ca.ET.141.01.1.1]|nr:HNH endonuclease [Mesorhizobium sp. M8A.F.Ca.ET.023.01.1.1]RWC77731.1 MAG: HNH endonuclease [Mesorhizobium sp.]TGV61084.1 HNH endonuclease [bacterium M00.F.Ca.ET.141.01.1.1]
MTASTGKIDDPNGGRRVKEWIGKTPDSVPPATVRARIFLRSDGICHISQRPIGAGQKWELEHVKPLALGGENRESNMRPALVAPHKEKSADENAIREKADRIRAKHLGVYPKSQAKLQGRGFAPTRRFGGTS